MVAASVGQARRTCFGVLRRMVEVLPSYGTDYLISENPNLCRVLHKPTGTEVTVLPASGRAAMGLLNARWIVADEPASWKPSDGALMHEALQGAHGKPGVRLRVLYVGTLAPAGPGNWWPELVHAGSGRSVHVTCYKGDRNTWDQWPTMAKANPLMWAFHDSRQVLRDERDAARRDSRLRARFLSYRLNCPAEDSSKVLLTTRDWKRALARDVAPRFGQPAVGLDLGAGRAWSAAVAVWPTGRAEAVAVCPGIPSVPDQEHRDRVPPGLYARLIEDGALIVAHGLRVPSASTLMALVREWTPSVILCDRFRLSEVQDAGPPCPVVPRVARWSSSTEDITALRRATLDGPLSVAPGSRSLFLVSLAAAQVKQDDGGNVRLSKDKNNFARDDVAQALILAAGEHARQASATGPTLHYQAPAEGTRW